MADKMECETCGAPDAQYEAIIEGARLHVCQNCARMGKVVKAPVAPSRARGSESGRGNIAPLQRSAEPELVDNYGEIIASARLKMRLPLAVVAELLSEKESFLDRIEHYKAKPTPELAKRIEKALGVILFEETGASGEGGGGGKPKFGGPTTLGDILEIEMKKKKTGGGSGRA